MEKTTTTSIKDSMYVHVVFNGNTDVPEYMKEPIGIMLEKGVYKLTFRIKVNFFDGMNVGLINSILKDELFSIVGIKYKTIYPLPTKKV